MDGESSSSSQSEPVRVDLTLSHQFQDDAYGIYLVYRDHVELHFDLVKKNKWRLLYTFANPEAFRAALPEITHALRKIIRCRVSAKVFRRQSTELVTWLDGLSQ